MSQVEIVSLPDTPDSSQFSIQKLLRVKRLSEVYTLAEKLAPLVRGINCSKTSPL